MYVHIYDNIMIYFPTLHLFHRPGEGAGDSPICSHTADHSIVNGLKICIRHSWRTMSSVIFTQVCPKTKEKTKCCYICNVMRAQHTVPIKPPQRVGVLRWITVLVLVSESLQRLY